MQCGRFVLVVVERKHSPRTCPVLAGADSPLLSQLPESKAVAEPLHSSSTERKRKGEPSKAKTLSVKHKRRRSSLSTTPGNLSPASETSEGDGSQVHPAKRQNRSPGVIYIAVEDEEVQRGAGKSSSGMWEDRTLVDKNEEQEKGAEATATAAREQDQAWRNHAHDTTMYMVQEDDYDDEATTQEGDSAVDEPCPEDDATSKVSAVWMNELEQAKTNGGSGSKRKRRPSVEETNDNEEGGVDPLLAPAHPRDLFVWNSQSQSSAQTASQELLPAEGCNLLPQLPALFHIPS